MVVIYETKEIPQFLYATVSYPWVGISYTKAIPISCTLRVPRPEGGGPDGDPISIGVLMLACTLALKNEARFLWLDRICINQLDAYDKHWQIYQMCNVYRESRICIIIPGGLLHLADLAEETPWIMRMWTLQEAIVPLKSVVLYESGHSDLTQLPKESEKMDLTGIDIPYLAMACCTRVYYAPLPEVLARSRYYRNSLFEQTRAKLLTDAALFQSWMRFEILGFQFEYRRNYAIWKSALTRSAGRPKDLLLSIMGIFDISLEEGQGRSEEHIGKAFIRELRMCGLADTRILAFMDAVATGNTLMSMQWKESIINFNMLPPLVRNGIAPDSDNKLDLTRAGPPITRDNAGHRIFLGSALVVVPNSGPREEPSLLPCRVVVSSPTSFSCLVTFGGEEREHTGRWELMPFDPERMEWVPSSHKGFHRVVSMWREPVKGGYELYGRLRHGEYEKEYRGMHYGLATVTDSEGVEQQFVGRVGENMVWLLFFPKYIY